MATNKSEQQLLSDISEKLDVVVGFLAIRGIENDQSAMVSKLSALELHPRIIGFVSGLSENAVNVRLSRDRKKKSKK